MIKEKITKSIGYIIIFVFLYLQQFQLSYSASVGLSKNLFMPLEWILLNMLIVAIPFVFAFFITRKLADAILINSVIITLSSLINYHILVFHGSPFFAGDIFSAKTAWNVLSEYYFILDKMVLRILILFMIQIILWIGFVFFKYIDIKRIYERKKIAILVGVNFLVIMLCFFSPVAIFKDSLFTWSWGKAVNQYGYGVCLLNSMYSLNHLYTEPKGYDIDRIEFGKEKIVQVSFTDYPNVILILNESLCDLSVYTDIPESKELFEKIEEIPDVAEGYSVSSLVGGGTNNSEYELLTSNSMDIFNISAPFISLNLHGANSIVSYFNNLNYTTIGMHCESPENYSRNRAYAELGFDKVYLGKDDFSTFNFNGNRKWLDSDNYLDLISEYEKYDNSPKFMYLLTYQNHGSYEQNDEKEDTVKVKGNYGDLTDDINEYLTSVKLSVEAFENLVNYYKNIDDKVIVVMLGDHAPAFVSELLPYENMSLQEQEIAKRMVPYYMWSNFETDKIKLEKYASMTDIVPLMLATYGFPLTNYYQTILQLNQAVPLRTSIGICRDANGIIGETKKFVERYKILQDYQFMEYNNVNQGEDYMREWFELNESVRYEANK